MKTNKNKKLKQIEDYDDLDTTSMINPNQPLSFEDLGVKLPDVTPTQVVSIRVPTILLNELKALSSEQDVPYQALIKLFLAESVAKVKKKKSA